MWGRDHPGRLWVAVSPTRTSPCHPTPPPRAVCLWFPWTPCSQLCQHFLLRCVITHVLSPLRDHGLLESRVLSHSSLIPCPARRRRRSPVPVCTASIRQWNCHPEKSSLCKVHSVISLAIYLSIGKWMGVKHENHLCGGEHQKEERYYCTFPDSTIWLPLTWPPPAGYTLHQNSPFRHLSQSPRPMHTALCTHLHRGTITAVDLTVPWQGCTLQRTGPCPLLSPEAPVPGTEPAHRHLQSVNFAECWMNHRRLYLMSLPLEKLQHGKDGDTVTPCRTPASHTAPPPHGWHFMITYWMTNDEQLLYASSISLSHC